VTDMPSADLSPTAIRLPRRVFVGAGLAWVGTSFAQNAPTPPSPEPLAATAAFAGGQPIRAGRVRIAVATLVDNGNTVPLAVRVDSPMSAADHVTEIAVFNEKNPQRDVARFALSPRNGRAEVATRIRLATSQKLVALARMNDGSVWQDMVDVVVVLAACIEGEG